MPFMYCCVFWCEFNDLSVFLAVNFFTPVTLFIIRIKGSKDEKLPAVLTLSTRRRFAAQKPIELQIFSTRGKLLSSLHRSKRLKARQPHACCWKSPRAKIPSFSRRCDIATGHGRWLRGPISPDRLCSHIQSFLPSCPSSNNLAQILSFTCKIQELDSVCDFCGDDLERNSLLPKQQTFRTQLCTKTDLGLNDEVAYLKNLPSATYC